MRLFNIPFTKKLRPDSDYGGMTMCYRQIGLLWSQGNTYSWKWHITRNAGVINLGKFTILW